MRSDGTRVLTLETDAALAEEYKRKQRELGFYWKTKLEKAVEQHMLEFVDTKEVDDA
jgi:hypothetical protein